MKQISGTGRNLGTAIHFTMAFCGGFFAVYAILSRMGNLGQAQTANLIEMVYSILGRDPEDVAQRLGAALIFIAGLAAATVLAARKWRGIRYLALALDAAAAVCVGCIPVSASPVAALYPVFFATAFQWCVFKGEKGYVSATIFCTNNLKQIVTALTEYALLPKGAPERREKLEKAGFFGGTFGSFYLGVLLGGVLWMLIGLHSIWLNLCPLLLGAVLVSADERQKRSVL